MIKDGEHIDDAPLELPTIAAPLAVKIASRLRQQLADYEAVLQWYAECHDVQLSDGSYAGQKARDILAKWGDEK